MEQTQKKQIRIADIVADIKSGLSRKEIKTKHSLNTAEAKVVFAHERVKGQRKGMPVNIDIVDDSTDQVEGEAYNSTSNSQQETPISNGLVEGNGEPFIS